MIDYSPLWDYLYFNKINRTDLANKLGISKATIARMGKSEPVSLDVICRIASYLELEIEEIVKIKR
jgi:DNA-binding Xre family transcriptional regulator